MDFGLCSPASSAFAGSPASFHFQPGMFPENNSLSQESPASLSNISSNEDLTFFIEQLSLPKASRIAPIEQLHNTPMLMNEALYNQAAVPLSSVDIMPSLSMLSMPLGANALLGIQAAAPAAPLAATWGMAPMATPGAQPGLAHTGMALLPSSDAAIDGSGASSVLHNSPLSPADCADFLPANNSHASSNNHQTLGHQPPAMSHYPPLFGLSGSNTPPFHRQFIREPSYGSATTASSNQPLDFAAPNNGIESSFPNPQSFGAAAAFRSAPPPPPSLPAFGTGDRGYASENSSGQAPRTPRGSTSWKSQPRNSISKRQKLVFYKWLLENTRLPFPSDEERLGRLAIEPLSEKQFKYWFANIRCRQFIKHRNPNGGFFFTPNAKFYESCLRLKIEIAGCIPVDVRRVMRKPRRSSSN
ncbi:hypothetical protein EV175_006555 [Coemansia sp. RSA 1933]|nr:hypothetical protein EV175_006555 [Coemansia sp. RSA 1933]